MKCEQYWPEYGVGNYGDIDVTIVREDVLAFYTLRTFTVTQVSVPTGKKKKPEPAKVHAVYQYHYTNWPDHGTPDNPLPVLSFVKKSSLANRETDGPIVVHCR